MNINIKKNKENICKLDISLLISRPLGNLWDYLALEDISDLSSLILENICLLGKSLSLILNQHGFTEKESKCLRLKFEMLEHKVVYNFLIYIGKENVERNQEIRTNRTI